MRYKVTMAYNGKNYHGWQVQPNAVTVQEVLNKCLSMLLHENIETIGAGRTDAGVHASFYVVHFDSEKGIADIPNFIYKINKFLPQDIAIYTIEEVSADFNARFSAKSREYKYLIHTKKDPFLNDSSWYYPYKLDFDLMSKGCDILLKTTDFASFCKLGADNVTTICQLMEARFDLNGHKVTFTIKADRFLRNMVRAVVGTLIDLGAGRITLEQFQQIVNAKNRNNAGQSVPGHALSLVNIEY